MEKKFQVAGSVFRDKTNNPHNSDNSERGKSSESMVGSSNIIPDTYGYNVLSNIQQLFKSLTKSEEMATVKLGWLLFSWIGVPIYIYTWAMALISGDEFKSWVLFGFSVTFGIIAALRAILNVQYRNEELRTKRIENDEREYNIKRKHSHERD